MHNKTILLAILVFALGSFNLSAQRAQWRHSIGGVNTDYATALVHDTNGNVYVTGTAKELAYFNDTCNSCSVTAEVFGNGNSYIVKYDSNGNYLWSKLLYKAHTHSNGTKAIHLIGNRIHVVFTYFDSIVIDPGSSALMINTPDKSAIIHLELDLNGNYIAHRKILQKNVVYGNDYWHLNDVDFDKNGNLFIAGVFGDTLSVNNNVYGTLQQQNGCIFKIEPNGQIAWFYDNMDALSISVNYQGYLYAGINFTDTINLLLNNVPTSFYTPDLPNSNLSDALLIRINPSGNIVTAKHISGKENQYIAQVRCNDTRVTIAGNFEDTLLYVPNGSILSCHGQPRDLYILQFRNDVLLWKKQLYSSGVVYPTDISYSPNESVFVSGIFADSLIADYKNAQIAKFSGGVPSLFTVKYSYGPFGFLEQFHSLISSNFQLGPKLDFIDDQRFYMIASYETQMPVHFTGSQSQVIARGGVDGFIAKYGTYNATSITDYTSGTDITVYPNPSNGIVQVSANHSIDHLSVHDYTGKKLFSANPNTSKHTFDLSNLANGTYMLTIGVNDLSKNYKLIILH